MDPDAECDRRNEADVQPGGVAEEAFEGSVVGVGGVGHGVRTGGLAKLAIREMITQRRGVR